MKFVTEAKYLSGYKISISFNDAKIGIADLENLIKTDTRKIINDLSDINNFTKFSVDMDTIVWQNGLDLSPEYLYSITK
jgi:hypothetical protein